MRSARLWLGLTLVPVLVIFAVCLADTLAWIGKPFPGFLVAENGIVVSLGRQQWTDSRNRSVPFARVLTVDGHPVLGGRDVLAYVSTIAAGKEVTYTLRNGTEFFGFQQKVRLFDTRDFLSLFVPLLGVGLLIILMSAAVVVRRPEAPEARAFFAVCLAFGLMLLTGSEAYSPYRFTPVFFLSLCAIPPASLQMALTYPQRWTLLARRPLAYLALYAPFFLLGVGLLSSMPDPSLFLPLLYTVYLLTANAAFLYVGGLVLGLIDGMRPREPILLSLAAVLGSGGIAIAILVAYPLLQRPISPALLVGPLLLLPLLHGIAFLRFAPPVAPVSESGSGDGVTLRSKLASMFFGALQVSFLTVVGTFWAVQIWQYLTDELALIHDQNVRLEHVLEGSAAGTESVALTARPEAALAFQNLQAATQNAEERALVDAVGHAFAGPSKSGAVRDAATGLKGYYQGRVDALRKRAEFVTHFSTVLIVGTVALVLGGMMAYFMAIRVWLVRPIQALGRATRVISTGDLGHRIPVTSRDEFGTLAASINTMAGSLAENQRRLLAAERFAAVGEMSAYVAHNIRNPLASIRVTAQTELLDVPASDPRRASFEDIVTAADRLESWLGDLLRFSSPVTLERTLEDVNALIERCAALARPLLARQGLVLNLTLDPALGYVALDRNKIEQVVSAVLSNAIDASPTGSTIRIASALHPGPNGSSRACLRVQDAGRGIPRERLKTLFTLFSTTKKSGTGLGLALAQKIVTAHHGTITVTSEEGEGTVVEIGLPAPATAGVGA